MEPLILPPALQTKLTGQLYRTLLLRIPSVRETHPLQHIPQPLAPTSPKQSPDTNPSPTSTKTARRQKRKSHAVELCPQSQKTMISSLSQRECSMNHATASRSPVCKMLDHFSTIGCAREVIFQARCRFLYAIQRGVLRRVIAGSWVR